MTEAQPQRPSDARRTERRRALALLLRDARALRREVERLERDIRELTDDPVPTKEA